MKPTIDQIAKVLYETMPLARREQVQIAASEIQKLFKQNDKMGYFTCPACSCRHSESDYQKPKDHSYPIISLKCKSCNKSLTLVTGLKGNVTVLGQ